MHSCGHVSELELDGLEVADGLPKLPTLRCILMSAVDAERGTAHAAGGDVDAAAIHCNSLTSISAAQQLMHCDALAVDCMP